jgi:hypothetical protein
MPLSLDIIISGVDIHTVNVMPLSLDIIICGVAIHTVNVMQSQRI